ncbi:hypothetical protein MNV49_000192 [Pseudohyphozyma bogoriensis]|nr:hypothetical protein MNV49_000192 [Pseudohyphozyma bogoriensis]
MLSAEERRRAARAMMDEDARCDALHDDDDVGGAGRCDPDRADELSSPVKEGKAVARTVKKKKAVNLSKTASPAASTSRSSPGSSPSSSSPRLAVKFGGKVFRTLDRDVAGVSYSTQGNLLGEPDEEIGDAERERGEKRRIELEREMLRSRKKAKSGDEVEEGTRKRKIEELTTPTKAARPPRRSPSPPLAHLDTPRDPPPTLGAPFSAFKQIRKRSPSESTPLPPVLAKLLTLHNTLESTLLLHLSSSGSAVASTSSQFNADGEAVLRIPNLVNLLELTKMMGSSGRTFGEKELAQLVWVWEGCGTGERVDDDDDLKLETGEAGGMGFIVTRTRASTSSGIVRPLGIGISVGVKTNAQLPKFELVPPTSPSRSPGSPSRRTAPPSPGAVGRGRDGMSVAALWTQGKDKRKEEFEARLREWGKVCALKENAHSPGEFPATVPSIPLADLPASIPAVHAVPGTTSPVSKKTVDVFGPKIPITPPEQSSFQALMAGKPVAKPTGSAKERMKSLAARIQAKADQKRSAYENLTALSDGSADVKKSLKKDKDIGAAWRVLEAERHQRNAMLSRLGSVADGVWMLFDVGRKRSIALCDVAASVAKSSKISLSDDEAQVALTLLCEVCPDFVYTKTVDREPWLCMKGEIGLREAKDLVREELARSKAATVALA